jgi:hypothetical protein
MHEESARVAEYELTPGQHPWQPELVDLLGYLF